MKALSLWQPYASAIAMGLKHYETRSWTTKYRGPLVIAAALTMKGIAGLTPEQMGRMSSLLGVYPLMNLPVGAALCVCDLVDVVRTEEVEWVGAVEYVFGDWRPNRYAWKLDRVRVITITIPIKGKQGLFTCPPDIAAYCEGLAP